MPIITDFIAPIARTALNRMSRRSLPQTEGSINCPGLNAPVEVFRDRWGVIHARFLHPSFYDHELMRPSKKAPDWISFRKITTISGSNWVPEHFFSSPVASSRLLLKSGCFLSVATTALRANGMRVRRAPLVS